MAYNAHIMLRSVEEQIQKAMREGEFDDLPGKGQPLDLSAYFSTPEHLRMAHSVLKGGRFVPEEVQLFRDIDELRARLAAAADDGERALLQKRIREKTLNLTVLLESHRRAK
jgi:hypothetical protein